MSLGLAILVARGGTAQRRAPHGRCRRGGVGARRRPLWAGYIVFGHRLALAADLRPQDGLAAGLVIGAACSRRSSRGARGACSPTSACSPARVVVAVASSVVPYSLEQLAMRRLARPRFAVMLALLPATATLMGAVVLGQVPSVADATGIGLVIGAIWLTA